MALDVIDLRQFYSSRLGAIALGSILGAVRARWSNPAGLSILGLGYPLPYLDAFREQAERCIALMPGRQGVTAWPTGMLSSVGLVDPLDLPLRESVIDRLLVIHALEVSEDAHALMDECWRILAPGGHLIVVAPNRSGSWARRDSTPFGHGQPYSRGQLTQLMRQSLFTPIHWTEALHIPPLRGSLSLSFAPAIERFGNTLNLPFAGVHIIEASKQLYRPVPARRAARIGARLDPVLVPSVGRNAGN
ncbi:MAG TPA: methyltransferase domain-containing protein [Beijerinckiaceae bacterium]|nr:methyltransferase domain-containing protein [Beijerinckiaceae bacterium]